MQIQEIENRTGMERATIRYYEKEGLIQPLRLQNGYRDYSEKNYSDLLKIKLLRQLGLTLEQISQIMRYEISLQAALDKQLAIIENRQELLTISATICQMLKQDAVEYDTVDPVKYLDKFSTPMLHDNSGVKDHTEDVLREIHPVRRFLARRFDELFCDTLIYIVVVLILRFRPFTLLTVYLLSVIGQLVVMVTNAFSLSLLGTTPGKWIMGIKIEASNGTKPKLTSMLRREWLVLKNGCGFYLPLYSLIKLLIAYNVHTSGLELEWDYDTESDVVYGTWQVKNEGICLTTAVAIILLNFICMYDAALPRHRSELLSVSQFAENYNDYAQQFGYSNYLNEEGEWYMRHYPGVVVDVGTPDSNIFFICNDEGYIDAISMTLSASGETTLPAVTSEFFAAILTAAVSQPGTGLFDCIDEIGRLEDNIPKSLSAGIHSGDLSLGGIHCKWNADLKGIHEFSTSHIFLRSEDASYELTVNISFP